ncbi:MAG: hypothetical protein IPI32_01950 [Austwickia sp.]|nr:hypothetical protein [Austwickia sp.]MBK8437722.1 hypothetical protein [Austwickia sp.]MBK9100032.1 hypothetical protein [Austwickia sp.]
MRKSDGSKWRWALHRPVTAAPFEQTGARLQRDDLRHLMATAGAMSWGITDVHLMAPRQQSGSVSAGL